MTLGKSWTEVSPLNFSAKPNWTAENSSHGNSQSQYACHRDGDASTIICGSKGCSKTGSNGLPSKSTNAALTFSISFALRPFKLVWFTVTNIPAPFWLIVVKVVACLSKVPWSTRTNFLSLRLSSSSNVWKVNLARPWTRCWHFQILEWFFWMFEAVFVWILEYLKCLMTPTCS